jgi:hypothetical protein
MLCSKPVTKNPKLRTVSSQLNQGKESDMQRRRLQLIEVLDEVLRLLPKQHYYIPKFEDHKFEYVPDIRRKPRVDAQGLKREEADQIVSGRVGWTYKLLRCKKNRLIYLC